MAATPMPAPTLSTSQQDRRSDILVLVTFLAALVVAWFIKTGVQYRTQDLSVTLDPDDPALGAISLKLPAAWQTSPVTNTKAVQMYVDPGAPSPYKTSIAFMPVRELDPESGVNLDIITDRLITQHTNEVLDFPGYQLLGQVKDVTVNGLPAKRIDYAYVARPIDIQQRNALPVVVHAIDYVVIKNNHIYVITETIDAQLYEDHKIELETIIQTVQLP